MFEKKSIMIVGYSRRWGLGKMNSYTNDEWVAFVN